MHNYLILALASLIAPFMLMISVIYCVSCFRICRCIWYNENEFSEDICYIPGLDSMDTESSDIENDIL